MVMYFLVRKLGNTFICKVADSLRAIVPNKQSSIKFNVIERDTERPVALSIDQNQSIAWVREKIFIAINPNARRRGLY